MVTECLWLFHSWIIVFLNVILLVILLLRFAPSKCQIVIELSELMVEFWACKSLNRADNQLIKTQLHVIRLRSPLICIHYNY